MANLHTKIVAMLVILLTCKTGNSQLTLESIFLSDKYNAVATDDIQFLHTKPFFARLIRVKNGDKIGIFNSKNELQNEWKIAASPEQNKQHWSNLIISNTDTYFLVNKNCEHLYRRSILCDYFLGDGNGKLTPLSDTKQLYPTFSPDDKKIAFIKNNNLYFKEISGNSEIQITKDGEWNQIINGKSDWVYEEELNLTRAYEWNAKSDKIAYLKFDETNVKEYQLPYYYDLQYPNYFKYKYPKVGEENSKVTVWLFDMKSKKNTQIVLPFSYEYIPRIYWNASGDEVIALLLNRHQDSLQLVGYNIKTKKTRQLYLETDKAYVEVPKTVQFLSDNSFLLTSEKDGFNHLYQYDKNGKLIKQLTNGSFEVKDLYGIDEQHKLIYFLSNENNETETVVYRLNYETLEKQKVSAQNGNNKASFSFDFSLFINSYSSASVPPQITIEHVNADTSIVIEDNKQLTDSLNTISNKEFIKIPSKDYPLNAWMIKPKNLDTVQKYPLLVYVYGGPNNQEVLNEWSSKSNLFFNFLAEQGYVVACVDNRGTGGRGSEFKKCTYLNLGKTETEDQLMVAEYLGKLPYIDKKRIGIFGWSYGGFLAANCLLEGNDIFKVGIAAAPVSNWNLYSSIYTEKYMRTPLENPLGYHNSNLNLKAKKLTGNLLLMHGTADDNVHFQHSIEFINALNIANKTYQLYLYPDAEHGTTGKKMRFDLYTKIYLYLKEKL